MRFVGAVLIMAMFAGCGLPGFANFAGEITVFFGAWRMFPLITGLALWGSLVIGAVYPHDPGDPAMCCTARCRKNGWPWPNPPGRCANCLTCFCSPSSLLFGFFPHWLSDKIKPDAEKIVAMVNGTGAATVAKSERGQGFQLPEPHSPHRVLPSSE